VKRHVVWAGAALFVMAVLLPACTPKHVKAGLLIVAAGDIACDPGDPHFDGGAGTSNHCQQAATANLIASADPTAVLALGDEQYECAGVQAFAQSYDPTWGQFKAITYPVPGNQEYNSSGGTGCDANGQASGYFQYFGVAAGDPGKGYYSVDVGTWHIIALNVNCSAAGGCKAGSPQEAWLKADLAGHHNVCTLAFWHQPRFSSGSNGNDDHTDQFWVDLAQAHADVVLNGHDHDYERFAPQDPNQQQVSSGIREFVVGTGGEDHGSFSGTAQPNSVVRNADTFGVLELSLHPQSYDWSFVPAEGGAFTDSGTGSCH